MATALQPMPMLSASQTADMILDASQWEGDQMFNVYIHDYFCRRGYKKSAQELQQEAKLGPEPNPPISSRQGLLFEWWTVFWGIFTAKSQNPSGETAITADAQSYMRWHMNNRNGQSFMNGASAQRLGPNGRPIPPSAPLTNGVPPPNGALTNGQIPNGYPQPNNRMGQPVGPPQPGQPRQPGMYAASPSMAPSPNSNANSQGSSGSGQGPGPSPRMSHLNRSMPPPSDPASARPPSRSDTMTPSRTGAPHQSPMMGNRMPMSMPPLPPGYRTGQPMPGWQVLTAQQIEQEYQRVPPGMLPSLRSELGISDAPQLSAEDKSRIVYHCTARSHAARTAAAAQGKPPGSGPFMPPGMGMQPNAPPGPSNNMARPGTKRPSASPEDNSMSANESSPSAAKRSKTSPESAPQSVPPHPQAGAMGGPGPSMGPGPGPGPPGFMNGRQPGPPGPGGIPPNMPPNSTPFNHPGSAMLPPGGHMMPAGMYGMHPGSQPGQPGPSGQMNNMAPPGSAAPNKIPNYSTELKQFTQTRMNELKPSATGMPPPSSPANVPKPPASAPPGGNPSMKMEASPSFAHTSVSVPGSMGSHTNPPTPVPGSGKMTHSTAPMSSAPSPGQILSAAQSQSNSTSANSSSGGAGQQQQQPTQNGMAAAAVLGATSMDFGFSDDLFGGLGNLGEFDFMTGIPQGPDDMSGLGFGRQFENWMDPSEALMK